MTDLKIRVFKIGENEAETTITIPGGIMKVAFKLMPKQTLSALQDKGIDMGELLVISESSDIAGTLVEVEDHKKNEKVVISLE